jgi:hypothetical protein
MSVTIDRVYIDNRTYWKLKKKSSYVSTDCQSVRQSWWHKAIWDPWPHSYCCQAVAGMLMWGVLPLWREDRSVFTICAGPRLPRHSLVRVRQYSLAYFTVSDSSTWKARALYFYPQECITFSSMMLVFSAYFGHRRWKQKIAPKHWYTVLHCRTYYPVEKPVNFHCKPIDKGEVMRVSETELWQ